MFYTKCIANSIYRGNITSETRNGNITTYEYDALGQLVRVNDPIDNTAFEVGGNKPTKKIFDYSIGMVGTVRNTIQ